MSQQSIVPNLGIGHDLIVRAEFVAPKGFSFGAEGGGLLSWLWETGSGSEVLALTGFVRWRTSPFEDLWLSANLAGQYLDGEITFYDAMGGEGYEIKDWQVKMRVFAVDPGATLTYARWDWFRPSIGYGLTLVFSETQRVACSLDGGWSEGDCTAELDLPVKQPRHRQLHSFTVAVRLGGKHFALLASALYAFPTPFGKAGNLSQGPLAFGLGIQSDWGLFSP